MLMYQSLAISHLWAPGLSLAFLHYKQGFNEHLYMDIFVLLFFEASNNSLLKILHVQTDDRPVRDVA